LRKFGRFGRNRALAGGLRAALILNQTGGEFYQRIGHASQKRDLLLAIAVIGPPPSRDRTETATATATVQ
jgi:hypothetical protein